MELSSLERPRPLEPTDDLSGFSCGVASIDAWVHERAPKARERGTAVVYVTVGEGRVAGLYSLSAHSIRRDDVPGGWLRRNAPESIPVLLLGMLAVDVAWQGRHVGSQLLRDALVRSCHVAAQIGARALVLDPVDEGARSFYLKYGFQDLGATGRMVVSLKQVSSEKGPRP
jgi:GNAT superfamily N-acetyltransferase